MFIKQLTISNFRLFAADTQFSIDDINVPDLKNDGSGLTAFVGENGCGKTALLEAIALPLLAYKADGFSLRDINNPKEKVHIETLANGNFTVDGTMPRNSFQAKGFSFEAGLRARGVRSYLSSMVVTDQKYIRADGEQKPKDNSPDLRVGVNNPFKGARFNENEILFLDRNRPFHTRSGTYTPTRFDRLMSDFNYQYVKSKSEIEDINAGLSSIEQQVENEFFKEATAKFKEISGSEVILSFIDNWEPFDRCFFAEVKEHHQQIRLDKLGSGYEMIFALLYSFYLAQQSRKQLIVLLDEPELHLHPSLQEQFVGVLLEFAKTAQIVLATHSPLLTKQLLRNEYVKVNILTKHAGDIAVVPIEARLLPYVSSNEVNFLAFGLATEEYHNELYEELKAQKGEDKTLKDFDLDYFQTEKGEEPAYPWKNVVDQVSIHTYVRNQIHHRKDNGEATVTNLNKSIKAMRKYLGELV